MNDDEPVELTPDEQHNLTNDPRLLDYPAAELFERLEWGRMRFLRWLVDNDRFPER